MRYPVSGAIVSMINAVFRTPAGDIGTNFQLKTLMQPVFEVMLLAIKAVFRTPTDDTVDKFGHNIFRLNIAV